MRNVLGPFCVIFGLAVGGAAAQDAAMSFFVTSANPGKGGGLAGADLVGGLGFEAALETANRAVAEHVSRRGAE